MRDPAADYIELLDDARRCTWCRYPYKGIYRVHLCRHCYDIKQGIATAQRRLEKGASRVPRISEVQRLSLELDLKTAEVMADLAKAEGVAYGSLANRPVTGLDLEHQFSFLSNHLVRKDLFGGKANVFNHSFDANQRRLLFHFLSLLNREYDRRHRRNTARSQVVMSYARQKPNLGIQGRPGASAADAGR